MLTLSGCLSQLDVWKEREKREEFLERKWNFRWVLHIQKFEGTAVLDAPVSNAIELTCRCPSLPTCETFLPCSTCWLQQASEVVLSHTAPGLQGSQLVPSLMCPTDSGFPCMLGYLACKPTGEISEGINFHNQMHCVLRIGSSGFCRHSEKPSVSVQGIVWPAE